MNRNDSGNPFEPGEALKKKNFNKFTMYFLLITLLLLLLFCLFFFHLFGL